MSTSALPSENSGLKRTSKEQHGDAPPSKRSVYDQVREELHARRLPYEFSYRAYLDSLSFCEGSEERLSPRAFFQPYLMICLNEILGHCGRLFGVEYHKSQSVDDRLSSLDTEAFNNLAKNILKILSSDLDSVEENLKALHDDWRVVRTRTRTADKAVDISESFQATLGSWDADFVGNAHLELLNYMQYWCNVPKSPIILKQQNIFGYMFKHINLHAGYANYTTVLQSSGMGKSRMVDELGKTVFSIPMCLREERTGFPPPDVNVRDFLTYKCEEEVANKRSIAFLGTLFEETREWIEKKRRDDKGSISYSALARSFRKVMTDGQKPVSHNDFRTKFYNNVCVKASKYAIALVQSGTPNSLRFPLDGEANGKSGETLKDKANALVKALHNSTAVPEDNPIVVLSFDEAHVLNQNVDADGRQRAERTYAYFSCLRRALLRIEENTIFSLFLSTTGHAFQFKDKSNWPEESKLSLIPPYTDIGYDQLALPVGDDEKTLMDVTKIEYQVRLGRPLFGTRFQNGNFSVREGIIGFAIEKLIKQANANSTSLNRSGKLACLATRLALDFYPYRASSVEEEFRQVEQHMRVCIQVGDGFESIRSVAPCEPILAEAARHIMNLTDFNPAQTLLEEFCRPNIERGARSETVMELLLLKAADKVVDTRGTLHIPVVDFFQELFTPPRFAGKASKPHPVLRAMPSTVHEKNEEGGKIPFGEKFAGWEMYLNQFVKVRSSKCITQEFLWLYLLRGVGIIYENNQEGVLIVFPIVNPSKKLGRKTVSAVMIQVKNDDQITEPRPYLFEAMDPFMLGIFNDRSQEALECPLPVIRLVTSLAGPATGLHVFAWDDEYDSKGKSKAGSSKPALSWNYTAYDFHVSGIGEHIYKPMQEEGLMTWSSLLDPSGEWNGLFQNLSPAAQAIRRSQLPLADADEAHLKRWSDMSGSPEQREEEETAETVGMDAVDREEGQA